MKAEGHLERANDIKSGIKSLQDSDKNVSSVVELVYGCALHYIAYTTEKKFGVHKDIHTGLLKFLRERDEDEIADAFSELETLRHGRWYGGKGNGDTIKRALAILSFIEEWKNGY